MRQEEQSLKSYARKKAKSDQLMAECKCLIGTWREPDEPGMRSLCMVIGTKGCQKPAHINGSIKATIEKMPRL